MCNRIQIKSYPKQNVTKLKGKAYSDLRKAVWKSQHGLCAECGRWVRLDGDTIFNTAHLAHIKSRGAGGEDTKENTRILCYSCHILKEHGLRWGKNG